jgi:succinate-semialdehyde dehydrogenase/glutarate-semialdehyde dehydrogenase
MIPAYESRNPWTGQLYGLYDFEPLPDLHGLAGGALSLWQQQSPEARAVALLRVAELLRARGGELAGLITKEMGKPLQEAHYEIDKSLKAFEYYCSRGPEFLKARMVDMAPLRSWVDPSPLGIILCIMPWNFPVWQVMRCAIPALLGGNAVLLKHAPNVPQCSRAIGRLFADAGLEEVFQERFLNEASVREALAHPEVAGLSFTGSDATGAYLAAEAGRNLKKVVMELGGNDPFIVLQDADVDAALGAALKSRGINSGQSCNAAKRFLVHRSLMAEWLEKLYAGISRYKVGDPEKPGVDIGPLARPDLAARVRAQISASIEEGAGLMRHPEARHEQGNVVYPLILTDCNQGVTAFREEIFGPVFAVAGFDTEEEAVEMANATQYGLGASLWTADVERALVLGRKIRSGNLFINEMVKSDPRVPFGGVKRSGFGRELSEFGLLEFVNLRTVVVG